MWMCLKQKIRLMTLKTYQQKNFKLKHKEKKNGQHKAKHKSVRGNLDAIKMSNLYLIRILDTKERLEHRGVFEDKINGQKFL